MNSNTGKTSQKTTKAKVSAKVKAQKEKVSKIKKEPKVKTQKPLKITREQKSNLSRIEFISSLRAAGVLAYETKEFSVCFQKQLGVLVVPPSQDENVPAPAPTPGETGEGEIKEEIDDGTEPLGDETTPEEGEEPMADDEKLIDDPEAFENAEINRIRNKRK